MIKKDSRIKYVYQRNRGPGSARNKGIEESKGDWIQLLDSDDWLDEDKIRFQLEYFRKAANNAGENIVLFSDYKVIHADSHQNILKEETQFFGNLSEDQILHRVLSWRFKDDCPLHSNSILSKRGVLDKDLFNETQKPAFTDLEFFVRLLTHKVKFIYTPIVGMYFRRHPKSRTTDKKYTQEGYVAYLELLYERKKELLDLIPHIENRIQMAFKRGNKSIFYRLLKIYNRPVRLPIGTIKISNKWGLKLIFFINLAKMKFLGHFRSKIIN